MSKRARWWLVVAVVAVLVVTGAGVGWAAWHRLPDRLTVDAAAEAGPVSVAASWGARGDLLDDRRLLREAYRAWVAPAGPVDAGRPFGDSQVRPSDRTEIRVVYAGRVDDVRLVAMVAPDGRAAVYRRGSGPSATLSTWDFLSTAGLPPALSLRGTDRGTVWLLHPQVRRLEVAVGGGDGEPLTWHEVMISDGLATVPPRSSGPAATPPCGNQLLRAELADGTRVTLVHTAGIRPLVFPADQAQTPAELAAVAQVACELPEAPLDSIRLTRLWSGVLPGVDGLVGEATAVWVRVTPVAVGYGMPVTDYGLLTYATGRQPAEASLLAMRLSYELPGPALLAGLLCLPTGAYHVAAGTEVIDRISLLGTGAGAGGTEVAGRVAAVPVPQGQCPAHESGSGFDTLLAVGFDDAGRPYAALSGAGPRSSVYR